MPGFKLSEGMYNNLKWIAQIFLPGVGTLYFALAPYWGWPKAEEVVGSIVAFDTFLGVLLGLSTRQYNRSDDRFSGSITLEPDVEADETMLNVSIDPSALETGKNEISLRVNHPEQ